MTANTANEKMIMILLVEEIVSSISGFAAIPVEEIPLDRMEKFLRKQVKIMSEVAPLLPHEQEGRLRSMERYFRSWIVSGDIPDWVDDAGDPHLDLRRWAETEWKKTQRDLKDLWIR